MADDSITIEVNGEPREARPGQMLIEVTDACGDYVPRFCYHEKLSVAANCRMCLVEVENAPKPLPACATPVSDGMKVFTRSEAAIAAQRATMEFLLINHPLDCPICDQGGECELQDLAMGYGRDVSRFTERKRSVADKNLGPLVSTDMTRCIHCTRCVRFGDEVAGIQELGTLGRGETMEIGTYIERAVQHELSGNIIDLCPVGALNNKPYRFSARAWEMEQRRTVSPHDGFGASLFAHVMGGKVKRVVPCRNEALNETWASDRDRFSYEGLGAPERATTPLRRRDGRLVPCSWQEALETAADLLRTAGASAAALVSPSATVEEGFLVARVFEHLGSANIDHRLRQRDFRDQEADPVMPSLPCDIRAVDSVDALLVVGSDLRSELPLLAHRVRTAALAGARVSFVEHRAYDYLFPVLARHNNVELQAELETLLEVARGGQGEPQHQATVDALRTAEDAQIWLGQIALRHPEYAALRRAAAALATETGSQLGYLAEGANAAGLALAGVLPHRAPGGGSRPVSGKALDELLRSPPETLLLLNVEPVHDCAEREAAQALLSQSRIIAVNPFVDESTAAHAEVVLPIATWAETAGTFVNLGGDQQSFQAIASVVGDSRPAWKVFRVLGNLLAVPDCDYADADAVLAAALSGMGEWARDTTFKVSGDLPPPPVASAARNLELGPYEIDSIVRRAPALQQVGRRAADEANKVA